MRGENRIIAIIIDWKIIKEFIVDKIKGLPKDVKIIGIRHEDYQMYDTIGLYSEKFDKIPDGIMAPIKEIKVSCKNKIIDGLEYINNN